MYGGVLTAVPWSVCAWRWPALRRRHTHPGFVLYGTDTLFTAISAHTTGEGHAPRTGTFSTRLTAATFSRRAVRSSALSSRGLVSNTCEPQRAEPLCGSHVCTPRTAASRGPHKRQGRPRKGTRATPHSAPRRRALSVRVREQVCTPVVAAMPHRPHAPPPPPYTARLFSNRNRRHERIELHHVGDDPQEPAAADGEPDEQVGQ